MKMLVEKYIKVEGLVVSKVVQMCIEENFYTRGDCSQYAEMQRCCKEYSGKIDDLKRIAMNIIEHSNPEILEEEFSDDYFEMVCQMMSMIEKRAGYTFYRYEQLEEDM